MKNKFNKASLCFPAPFFKHLVKNFLFSFRCALPLVTNNYFINFSWNVCAAEPVNNTHTHSSSSSSRVRLLSPKLRTLKSLSIFRRTARFGSVMSRLGGPSSSAPPPASTWQLRQAAVKELTPVAQHAAGRQCRGWPLTPHRKGMWKLFHPGQKPKTPGRLGSGGSFLLSAFLIRGSKPRLGAKRRVFGWGFGCFRKEFHPAGRIVVLLWSVLFVVETKRSSDLWPFCVCSFKTKTHWRVLISIYLTFKFTYRWVKPGNNL